MTPVANLKRQQDAAARRELEDRLALHLRAHGIAYVREFSLPGRMFRWDFAFPEPSARLLVEVHGGIWMKRGAHNTGAAITRDCEKAAFATAQGWRHFAVTGDQISSGKAYQRIKDALGGAA